MAYNKLPYTIDNLDKAKKIVENNMKLVSETILHDKGFSERWRLLNDVHWGEKITLANKVIDHLNYQDGANS